MKKLAVLISNTGTGTNLQAIIDAIEEKGLRAKILVVISDTESALGLKRAKNYKLHTEIVSEKGKLLEALKKYNPDYICLCGWKQFITNDVIDFYSNKILNLHPGIIPEKLDVTAMNPDGTQAEWNRGKLTSSAIKQVLDTKNTYAGSSIHFLTHEFDFGKVLGRCYEKVREDDTIDSLYARLKVKENKLYQDVLIALCQ